MAKIFSCQRPRTLAVVYVIPSSPDRRYQKTAIKDLFILLIKLLIRQNVCQRQPQCFRSVLSLQNAPSDCQGNFLSSCKQGVFSCICFSQEGKESKGGCPCLPSTLCAHWFWKEMHFKAEFGVVKWEVHTGFGCCKHLTSKHLFSLGGGQRKWNKDSYSQHGWRCKGA